MQAGTVKFFDVIKGFGFVRADDGGAEFFVHKTALEKAGIDSIDAGQKVKFNTRQHNSRTQVDSIAAVQEEENVSFSERAAAYIASKEDASISFGRDIKDLCDSLKNGRRFSWGRTSRLVLSEPYTEGSKVAVCASLHASGCDYFPSDWYFTRGELGRDVETGRYFFWYGFDGDFDPKRSFHRRNRLVWSRNLEELKLKFYAGFIADSFE